MDTNRSATHAAYCTVAATGNIIAKPTSTSPRASASLPPVSSSTPTTSPEPGLSTNKQLQIASIPPVESISGFHFPPWPLLSPLSPVYVFFLSSSHPALDLPRKTEPVCSETVQVRLRIYG